MKKLKIFLLILLVFSVFIPKTYASTAFYLERFSGTVHSTTAPYELINSYTEVKNIETTSGQFLDFTSVFLDTQYIRDCDGQSFIYRIDYQLFGWHNPNKTKSEWVQFAKLIQPTRYSGVPNTVEVLGSVLNIPSEDKVNVSTFIKYTWGTASDCATGSHLNLTLAFNDSASDLYFYHPDKTSNYYTIYDSAYELTNEQTALDIINEYYSNNSITQDKLDSIDQKLIDTNEKLDEIENALNNVNQNISNTNDKLDDLNDNITNSDITGSQNTANGFFNNFNTEDNGGLSAIVTAPLRAINSMVDGTCQPLTATWRGKTISLPCGTEFWDKMSPIRIFLNVIEGGIICYGILIDMYKMINRMKNPEDDRVDVMKL